MVLCRLFECKWFLAGMGKLGQRQKKSSYRCSFLLFAGVSDADLLIVGMYRDPGVARL